MRGQNNLGAHGPCQSLFAHTPLTKPQQSATAAPTQTLSTYAAACAFVTATGTAQAAPIYACAYAAGCTVALCEQSCGNSTLLFPLLGMSGHLGASGINSLVNMYASLLSGLSGTCTALTCATVCTPASGSALSLSAAAAVAATMIAVSMTQ